MLFAGGGLTAPSGPMIAKKMKKHFLQTVLAVLSLLAAACCGKDVPGPDAVPLRLDRSSLSFGEAASGAELTFTASARPGIVSDGSAWVSARLTSFEDGGGVIRVSVQQNTEPSVRSASFIVKVIDTGESASFVVTQAAAQEIEEPEITERNPAVSLCTGGSITQAESLYGFLLSVYGNASISGAVGGTAWETGFSDFVAAQADCGAYPAVVGFDYLFIHYPAGLWGDANPPDYFDIAPVKAAADAGNIVQICWHWNMPGQESDFTDIDGMDATAMSWDERNAVNEKLLRYSFYIDDFREKGFPVCSISEALREGSWQNRALDYYIARVASSLKLLSDAGIPLLFRPLHEAAGDYGWNPWFWWGNEGPEQFVKLWRYLYDAIVHTHGVKNLIWVYTMQTGNKGALASAEEMRKWYPGDEYTDIVGADLYVAKNTTQAEVFKRVNTAIAGRKMVALSEIGNLMDIDGYFASDTPWLYWMGWCNSDSDGNWTLSNGDSWNNSASDWRAALTNSRTLNRGDINY